MARLKGGASGYPAVMRWASWALGLLALASAFVPLSHDLTRALRWALCLYGILECGVAIARQRRGALAAYAAVAILLNPFVPFDFPAQLWRLLYAASGVWLIADHVAGGG